MVLAINTKKQTNAIARVEWILFMPGSEFENEVAKESPNPQAKVSHARTE
jgi:hypothetical protein